MIETLEQGVKYVFRVDNKETRFGRALATPDRKMKTDLLFTKNVTFWFRLRIAKTSSWMDSCNGKPLIFRISSDTLIQEWEGTMH